MFFFSLEETATWASFLSWQSSLRAFPCWSRPSCSLVRSENPFLTPSLWTHFGSGQLSLHLCGFLFFVSGRLAVAPVTLRLYCLIYPQSIRVTTYVQYFLFKTEVSTFIMDFSFIRTHLCLILVTFYLGSYLTTEFEYFLSKNYFLSSFYQGATWKFPTQVPFHKYNCTVVQELDLKTNTLLSMFCSVLYLKYSKNILVY